MIRHAGRATNERTATRNEIRDAFTSFDANGDGTLQVEELVGIMTDARTGHAMTRAEANAFLSKFDVNRDGCLDLNEAQPGLEPAYLVDGSLLIPTNTDT